MESVRRVDTTPSKKVARLDKKIARVGKRKNKDGFGTKRLLKLVKKRHNIASRVTTGNKNKFVASEKHGAGVSEITSTTFHLNTKKKKDN